MALPAQLRGLEHAALGLLQGVKGHAGGAVGAEQQAAVRLPELCGRTGNDKLSDSFNAPTPHPPGQPASLPVPHPLSCCWSGQRSPSWSPKATLDWTVGKKKKRQLPVTTEGSHHYVAGWWPNRLAANKGGFRD